MQHFRAQGAYAAFSGDGTSARCVCSVFQGTERAQGAYAAFLRGWNGRKVHSAQGAYAVFQGVERAQGAYALCTGGGTCARCVCSIFKVWNVRMVRVQRFSVS